MTDRVNLKSLFTQEAETEEKDESVVGKWRYWKEERVKNVRSWSTFFSKSRFSVPSPSSLPARVRGNVVWYISNYIIVFLLLSCYAVVSNPLFLIAIAVAGAAWWYNLKKAQELKFCGEYVKIGLRERSVVLVLLTALLFYLVNVGVTLSWLIGASVIFIVLHAVFHRSEEESSGASGIVDSLQDAFSNV